MSVGSSRVIATSDLKTFFKGQVRAAAGNQHLTVAHDTVDYVANLLVQFLRSEQLFEQTPDGRQLRPLALTYADAVASMNERERRETLKRLGDVALFISGLFAQSLSRKLVDVDYYIAMGGGAYAELADITEPDEPCLNRVNTFGELSEYFARFVDVLAEVAEGSSLSSDHDVLRTYEIWMKTGSARAARALRRAGIEPSADATRTSH